MIGSRSSWLDGKSGEDKRVGVGKWVEEKLCMSNAW